MINSREVVAFLGKGIWQQRILPLLDGKDLAAFSRASHAACELALLTLIATRLAQSITRKKSSEAKENNQKKACKQSEYAYRSLTELMQVLRCMPIRYRPFIPYLLMVELAQNHAEILISDLLQSRNAKQECYENMTTSCVNTTLLSLIVMSGYMSMKQINCFISPSNLMRAAFSVKLPSGASHELFIDNVFNKIVVTENITNSDYAFFARGIAAKNAELNQSFNDDNKVITAMNEYILGMEFMNTSIKNLREHIDTNKPYTTTDNSYIYTVKASVKANMCHHNFLIEQFYCDDTQSVRYRLYQSWIGLASLHDYLGHEFTRRISHSWDSIELYRFLTRIELFYSNRTSGKISEKDCFGMGGLTMTHRFKLQHEGNIFHSACVLYYCKKINPAECMNNLTNYVDKNPKLSAALFGK